MKNQYDVLVVGELNIDLILNQIDTFPVLGKEILSNHMTLTLGSSSAIFACNISTLGSSVTFIGKLGHDNFGDHILSSLKSKGVNTTHILHTVKHNTGATIVLNYSEDRSMVTYPGAMRHLTEADITDEVLQQSRHLHVSSIFLQTGLKDDLIKIFKKAKESGLTTSIDPQWDPAEKWDIDLENLLPHVDVFMPNAAELKALTQNDSIDGALTAIKPYSNCIVVKNGTAGAYLWSDEEYVHQPAFLNTEVVDSIGAGDSFNAGFIHAFLQKKPLKECLAFGALTGAISTTRSGGTGAFENLNLVKTIAQSTFNQTL